MDIKWEAPPRASRGTRASSEDREAATMLRANPGAWARLKDFDLKPGAQTQRGAQLAGIINADKRAAFRSTSDGKFEAVSRTRDGKNIVYVRFVSF